MSDKQTDSINSITVVWLTIVKRVERSVQNEEEGVTVKRLYSYSTE